MDIMKVPTTGASSETSRQDKLQCSGVAASEAMAREDSGRMEKYRSKIKGVGCSSGIHPALIAGIISRETRAGKALVNGWGDYGKAWGLMQVDVTPPPNGGGHMPRGGWDSEEHLHQATGILDDFIRCITAKFPNWSREQQLKGGLAAFNKGDGNVRSGYDVDHFTTGRDYSNDVIARAQYYKKNCGY